MTEPLITHPFVNERDKKVPPDLDGKLIRDLIDVGWMSEKGLKWFGWDVNGWLAWTDAKGMIYRIRDLKRNEDGKRFEKEVKNIVRGDEPRDDIHANANQLYQHEFNLCVDCQLCPDRSGVTDGDDDSNTSTDAGGGAKEEEVNVTAPPWQTFAGGGTPDYGGINTGSNPNVPGANYGGYGDIYTEYTPPTANPSETIKTDVVTDTSKTAGSEKAREGIIKRSQVAKIDNLRIKPNIPPQNGQISFPKPSKPINDADEWFKQPDQNPAKKPKQVNPKTVGRNFMGSNYINTNNPQHFDGTDAYEPPSQDEQDSNAKTHDMSDATFGNRTAQGFKADVKFIYGSAKVVGKSLENLVVPPIAGTKPNIDNVTGKPITAQTTLRATISGGVLTVVTAGKVIIAVTYDPALKAYNNTVLGINSLKNKAIRELTKYQKWGR